MYGIGSIIHAIDWSGSIRAYRYAGPRLCYEIACDDGWLRLVPVGDLHHDGVLH